MLLFPVIPESLDYIKTKKEIKSLIPFVGQLIYIAANERKEEYR